MITEAQLDIRLVVFSADWTSENAFKRSNLRVLPIEPIEVGAVVRSQSRVEYNRHQARSLAHSSKYEQCGYTRM